MFHVDDHVIYRAIGVCRIAAIRPEKLGRAEEQEYYVLKPCGNPHSTIYVSTTDDDALGRMRPLMGEKEILDLISTMPEEEGIWISNDRQRSDSYNARVQAGDCHEFVRLIKALYIEREKRKETGKTLSQADVKIMTTAERLLHEEIALVLGIKIDEVVPFIKQRIESRSSAATTASGTAGTCSIPEPTEAAGRHTATT